MGCSRPSALSGASTPPCTWPPSGPAPTAAAPGRPTSRLFQCDDQQCHPTWPGRQVLRVTTNQSLHFLLGHLQSGVLTLPGSQGRCGVQPQPCVRMTAAGEGWGPQVSRLLATALRCGAVHTQAQAGGKVCSSAPPCTQGWEGLQAGGPWSPPPRDQSLGHDSLPVGREDAALGVRLPSRQAWGGLALGNGPEAILNPSLRSVLGTGLSRPQVNAGLGQ